MVILFDYDDPFMGKKTEQGIKSYKNSKKIGRAVLEGAILAGNQEIVSCNLKSVVKGRYR